MSSRFARLTTTPKRQPKVSVAICLFLPFVFSPIETTLVSGISGLYTLRINDGISRIFSASSILPRYFYQMFQNPVPKPAQASTSIKAVYRKDRRKIMRKLPPFTARIYKVQYRIGQLSCCVCILAFRSRPLVISQVCRITLTFQIIFFHLLIIPLFSVNITSQACSLSRNLHGVNEN